MRIKTLLILLSLPLFFYEHGAAQWPVYTEDIVADAQEVQPVFRGGSLHTFADWVKKQVIYFQDFSSPKGVVEMYFTVDKKGKIQDVEFESSPNPELTDAVLKAIGKAPKMTPGTKNGKPSEFRLTATIDFDSYSNPEADSDSPNPPSDKALRPTFQPWFSKSGKKNDRERDMNFFKEELVRYLSKNQYGKYDGGKAEIVFTVNSGGYVENVTINKSSSRALLKVVMKAMYSLPKWHSPGLADGKPVPVSYILPIIIPNRDPLDHFIENPPPKRFH